MHVNHLDVCVPDVRQCCDGLFFGQRTNESGARPHRKACAVIVCRYKRGRPKLFFIINVVPARFIYSTSKNFLPFISVRRKQRVASPKSVRGYTLPDLPPNTPSPIQWPKTALSPMWSESTSTGRPLFTR